MAIPMTREEQALMPVFPAPSPGPAGSSMRGCIVLVRAATVECSTERVHKVIATAKAFLAEGADPSSLVPVIRQAQRILRRRGLTTETVE